MPSKLLTDLFQAYFDTRKNKRNTINALRFELEYEKNLFALFEEIKNYAYKIGPSTCFVVEKPIRREIFAADFRDRIVHHLIFNYINPIFEKHFIKDSYSCRIDKGTSYGVERADHFIRSCSENYQKNCWILKLDIKGYFMSMDRNILYSKIENKLQSLENPKFDINLMLYLIRAVVFNDPTKNCRVKGKREDWVGLPKSKSLFFAGKNKGFPIGNLTSQLFGNIYLDEFDHFAKEKFGIKYYGRYVDDIIIVHPNKKYLTAVISRIRDYLQKELTLKLHPKKIYFQHFSKGVKFLGTVIKPHRIYIGNRTKNNFYQSLGIWNREVASVRNIDPQNVKKFIASANSFLGTMSRYDTFKLRKKIIGEMLGGGALFVCFRRL